MGSDGNMRKTENTEKAENTGKQENAEKTGTGGRAGNGTGRAEKYMRRLCAGSALGLSVCLLTGCRLAREEMQAQCPEEDRLVGLFLTEQYLDRGTPELTVSPGGEISFAGNREGIAGTLIFDEGGPKDIVFDGIEGYGVYDISVWNEEQGSYTSYAIADDIFSDGYWAVNVNDTSETNAAEVTVYVEPGGPDTFYFNPVYQTAGGDVYLLPGTGLSCAGDVYGASSTHTVSQEWKISENGQETVRSSSFDVCIIHVKQTVSYRLLFMDGDSNVADIMTGEELAELWDAGQWEITVPAGTAYLVLEQEEEGGDVQRTLCNRGETSMEFLQSAGGGYLVKQQMSMIWE